MKKNFFKFIILIVIIIAIIFIVKSPQFNKILFKIDLFFTKPSEVSEIVFDKSSFQYVNNLYFCNSLYYNNLSIKEQEIYKEFLTAVKNYEDSFEIDYNTFDTKNNTISSLEKISYAITADHPELIQFSHSSINIPGNSNENYTILLEYTYSKEYYNSQIEYIENCLNDIYKETFRKK